MNRFLQLLTLGCILAISAVPLTSVAAEDTAPGMDAKTFSGLKWRGIGPALMSGRIADIAVDPERRSTWYVAVGSGGVWKTENRGTTWTSVFDGQGSYSIGVVTIDPNDSNVIWVGTGENVSGRHVGYGDGVYRSLDGGSTWENMGLKESEHIGMIRIDPRDSDVIYVAAQGPLWSGGGDRGLFKSTDGGKSWNNVLSGGEYTGVNEVHLDPRNPDVVYAAKHQRLRTVAALINGGPESGIFKSTDGGQTWRELTNGIPAEDKGKIGLAISPIDPDVVYATIELGARKGGFWRSTDAGGSWEKRSDYLSGGTGPHYYQEIFASPHKLDRVYQMDAMLHISDDGGKTFVQQPMGHRHSDHHATVFDPNDPDYVMYGTDGGIYESFDDGKTFRYIANLPITQFYKVAVDYDEPFYNVYGGTQDNNSQGGPSRTMNTNGIRNSDWFITLSGDGHQPAVDPTNPDIVYSQWQKGNITRYDRKTGETVYIKPQPAANEPNDRFNWDAPILISPHDPKRIYFASQRVWRSDNRGDSWTAISGDLSHGRDRLTMEMMGRVWSIDAPWDLMAMSEYGTITSLSESPVEAGLLYAGTDDGRIHVSENGGESWRAIERLPGAADDYFVNDIKADRFDADTVYVVVDDHKNGDFSPYIYKSTNRGGTWVNISKDLPERHIVWRLVQDHEKPGLLFAGTEFGVFFTVDGGKQWIQLSGDAPTISFRDLAIQERENDLVGATFGRSFWILDDYTPLRQVDEKALEQESILFPVRDAPWYIPRQPLGDWRESGKAFQGDGFFTAPNPPFGATFTYFLRDSLKTTEQQRQEREKKRAKAGEDTPYPGWDALREEELEDSPAIVLTVTNADGNLVRRIEGPVSAGIHRVSWDLRYAQSAPWTPKMAAPGYINFPGPLAAPGRYSVSIAKRENGVLTDLGQTQQFDVVSIVERGLQGASPDEAVAFFLRLDDLRRQVGGAGAALDSALTEVSAIKATLLRSSAPAGLREEAVRIERELKAVQETINGNPRRNLYSDPGPVSISGRIMPALMGNYRSTYGPTPMHLQSVEIAENMFSEVKTSLDSLLGEALPTLRQQLNENGVPWTPGRGVPAGE